MIDWSSRGYYRQAYLAVNDQTGAQRPLWSAHQDLGRTRAAQAARGGVGWGASGRPSWKLTNHLGAQANRKTPLGRVGMECSGSRGGPAQAAQAPRVLPPHCRSPMAADRAGRGDVSVRCDEVTARQRHSIQSERAEGHRGGRLVIQEVLPALPALPPRPSAPGWAGLQRSAAPPGPAWPWPGPPNAPGVVVFYSPPRNYRSVLDSSRRRSRQRPNGTVSSRPGKSS